jgi:hypothetical protein
MLGAESAWSAGSVLMAVAGASRLAGTRLFMQAGLHLLLVRVILLNPLTTWSSRFPSLILYRLPGRDPMESGAAMLRADWLDGKSLEDWHSE